VVWADWDGHGGSIGVEGSVVVVAEDKVEGKGAGVGSWSLFSNIESLVDEDDGR
jgi:hypothetical protein